MRRLEGKLALITGGNSGIGLATAKAFIAEGARVAITGRDTKRLETAKQSLGDGTLAVRTDVADIRAIEALMAAVKDRFGGLDVLFVNAGVGGLVPLGQVTEPDFDRTFGVNVKGLFFTVQKAMPLMRRGGAIILNASVAPRMGRRGASLYSGSKAAVRAFARNFSAELAPRGIRVNVVSPGSIETPLWSRNFSDPDLAQATRRQTAERVPLKRMGTAEEVAAAVLFLASDESSYIVGSEIVVDGGRSELPAAR
jgi:NAD(P)-dependent dehydrogenase (short-subunit alcohol dehydrogenase family)